MINFLKQIFTWWHKQTVGTFFYTLLTGKLAGIDSFGNKYYYNLKGDFDSVRQEIEEERFLVEEFRKKIYVTKF